MVSDWDLTVSDVYILQTDFHSVYGKYIDEMNDRLSAEIEKLQKKVDIGRLDEGKAQKQKEELIEKERRAFCEIVLSGKLEHQYKDQVLKERKEFVEKRKIEREKIAAERFGHINLNHSVYMSRSLKKKLTLKPDSEDMERAVAVERAIKNRDWLAVVNALRQVDWTLPAISPDHDGSGNVVVGARQPLSSLPDLSDDWSMNFWHVQPKVIVKWTGTWNEKPHDKILYAALGDGNGLTSPNGGRFSDYGDDGFVFFADKTHDYMLVKEAGEEWSSNRRAQHDDFGVQISKYTRAIDDLQRKFKDSNFPSDARTKCEKQLNELEVERKKAALAFLERW